MEREMEVESKDLASPLSTQSLAPFLDILLLWFGFQGIDLLPPGRLLGSRA